MTSTAWPMGEWTLPLLILATIGVPFWFIFMDATIRRWRGRLALRRQLKEMLTYLESQDDLEKVIHSGKDT